MDLNLKQRLVGATVLIAAAVIFVPMILDGPVEQPQPERKTGVPLIMPEAPEQRSRTQEPATEPDPGPDVAESGPESEPESGPVATEPAPAAVGDGDGWALQLGSFARRQNAEDLAGAMRARGFENTIVQQVEVENGTMYRVRIGPYAGREQAVALVERVREASGERAVVVSHP